MNLATTKQLELSKLIYNGRMQNYNFNSTQTEESLKCERMRKKNEKMKNEITSNKGV